MPPPNQNQRKRIAIVGAAGRLGAALADSLQSGHEVLRLTRREFDLRDPSSISSFLGSLEYDMLVMPGALTAVDYCETHEDEAFAINAEAPRLVAEISAAKGAQVTYLSTDMVFNGQKENPYLESDLPDPISVYGASKLRGEEHVLGASSGNLVVRVSWLYGPGKPAFPEWIIEKACKESSVTLPGNKICCPTFSTDLVRHLQVLWFGAGDAPASGLFHLCDSSPCTWRDWGQFCIDTAREAGLPVRCETIEPVDVASVAAFTAKRPINSAMDTSKFSGLTGVHPRHWKTALREFLHSSELFKTMSPASSLL